jgi:hypothetical protein
MISCDFTGNCGNHLFQYAITRLVAEKNKYEWGFNPVASNDYYGGKPQIDFMNINYGKQHTARWKEMPEGITDIWEEKFEHFNFENGDSIDFHHFQPEIFDVKDNTKLVVRCCQDERYFHDSKEKLKSWFQIKPENIEKYDKILKENNVVLNDDLCIINCRGGEYLGIPSLLLESKYWADGINYMRDVNPKMKFLVVTDDPGYARSIFPYNVVHYGIGMDYYIINQAKNLLISNSSFAIFPTYLNPYNPFVIAPRFWAKHNVSNGYWASSNVYTFKWSFLDRDGGLYHYA